MKILIALAAVTVTSFVTSLQAQQLLTPGQSFTYEFSGLTDFGDGYAGPARGFATFLTDPARSTPGATYAVDLFENNVGENPLASVTGTGNVTASAPGAFPDEAGVVRVTVISGDVYFESFVLNVYEPTGFGDFRLWTTDIVPVPEPNPVVIGVLGVVGLIGWNLRKRRH